MYPVETIVPPPGPNWSAGHMFLPPLFFSDLLHHKSSVDSFSKGHPYATFPPSSFFFSFHRSLSPFPPKPDIVYNYDFPPIMPQAPSPPFFSLSYRFKIFSKFLYYTFPLNYSPAFHRSSINLYYIDKNLPYAPAFPFFCPLSIATFHPFFWLPIRLPP